MQQVETLLTRKQAAEFLRQRNCAVSYNTLGNMASLGEGPPYFKDGNRALYSPEELDEWRSKRLKRMNR